MIHYRAIKCFGIKYEHTTIYFNINEKWTYVGDHNRYKTLHRGNVFVDVTDEQLKEFFKEQKNE